MDARYSKTGAQMKLPLIFLAAALWMASTCHAQNVVGCTDGSGTTYQAPPCPTGTTTMPTSIAMTAPSAVAETRTDVRTDVVPAAAAPPPRVSVGRKSIQSSRDELQVGMSDLQVLNNRRWGKPQKITRNREDRV